MPHDVTMPQLGMAQDAGRIVSWLKAPGDPVAKGDALFEVETDKATMEVEAQASGFLTGVRAAEGDEIPVGEVIARITEHAEDDDAAVGAAAPAGDPGDALPEGVAITMPQLGMAQDSGILVSWQQALGAQITADDVLFEVETDKSTMEVPAGVDGYLAATLAEAGEEVPVGQRVAIISARPPDSPVTRSVAGAPAQKEPSGAESAAPKAPAPAATPERPAARPAPDASAGERMPSGRVLASPKARRLALEQGLDLNRLAEAGVPQPYHVRDLETLRSLPAGSDHAPQAVPPDTAVAARHLIADCAGDGFDAFADWAAGTHAVADTDALLAGLAGASLNSDRTVVVVVERFGARRGYDVPTGRALSCVAASEGAPALIVRDLRATHVRAIALGAEDAPVLTITRNGARLSITLECAPATLDASGAIALLTDFAGRMEQPLRHLL